MDEFPFSSFVTKKSKTKNTKSKKKDTNKDKGKKNIVLKKLVHSNSDSDFVIKSEKEKRKVIRQLLHKKNIIESMKESKESKDSKVKQTPYKKGNNLRKIIKKNKNDLSDLIQNNSQKVELFGNPRYNRSSPILFVEDFKNNIPEKKMGLVPLPSKKKNDTGLYKEPKNLFDMQRNISMTRRIQYEKNNENKFFSPKSNKNRKDDQYFKIVQSWWKHIPKIILIQRLFRGHYIRNQVDPIIKLYRFMKNFEKFLINLELKDYFKRLKDYPVLMRRKIINGSYITKKSKLISNRIYKNIIMIENGFRCYRAKTKRNYLGRGKNGRVINHMSYISKVTYVNQNKLNNNILKLQNRIKSYINKENYFDRNIIHKDVGTFYYDKIYLNRNNIKIIEFMKLITHGLQLIAFKKKIFYKNPNEYNEDDINKIKYIQKKYLDYFYNNIKNISFYKIRGVICYINKIRKEEIIKDIENIQKQTKTFLKNKNNYEKSVIRNKPISDNNVDNNNNNEINANNSSYISKQSIINVNKKLIPLQKMIHKINQKRIDKYKENKRIINKNHIHSNYLFTKECSNQGNSFKAIKNIQKMYKEQYKNNKNSIISNDNEYLEEYSSLEDCSKPKYIPLRQQKLKNKIPKNINFGLYISKKRLIRSDNKYGINSNKKDYLFYRQEGLFITKIRHINLDKQIKKIQNSFKIYKKNTLDKCIQKPLTDNKNFYTLSSDSYDDVLYSKKLSNYYYLSKVTKQNIEDKVKTIQNNYLKYSNIKKAENEFLNKVKTLLNIKRNNGFGFYESKIRYGPTISKALNENKNISINYVIPQKTLNYITKTSYYGNNNKMRRNLRNKINKDDNIISRKQFFKNYTQNYEINGKDISNSQLNNDIASLGLYISKKYKRIVYKREKSKNYLITKIKKNPENMTQINIKFLLLTSLFITKNIKQYIFNLLKNKKENFEYPFYLNTIYKVLKYLQSNDYKGRNVQFLFNKIISDYNSNSFIKKDSILLLTKEKENDLINTDIYNNIDQDFLDYICGYAQFDKNFKNEKFLNVRLNNTIFHNTNIFTITKFINDEFANFLNGKYCYKCYLDLNLCKCFKSNDELTDDALDIGLNDDYNPKNSIKFFEYDINKTKGTHIQGKPKIDDKNNIITKSHFNNQINNNNKNNNNMLLNEGNSKKNNLFNSKKKFETLRYYNNNDQEKK